MKRYLVHTLFLLFSGITFAQVQLKVDTTHIRIGEQINFEITTEVQPKVQFPKLQLDSLGKVEVVHSLPVDTIKNRLYKKYILTSFDSGSYQIPEQRVLINGKSFFTDSLLINVGTVVIDTTKQKLFPIKGIYKAPQKTWRDYINYLWWLFGALVLLALLWWFALRSRKTRKEKAKKQLTPIEEALTQFLSLDKRELLEQQKIKEYYVELTEIVRDYIGKDMQIPTMEVTTDELITLLELHNKSNKIGIDKERIKQLHSFLKEADLVKFAKYKPTQDQIQEDRKTAELVINDIQAQVHKPILDEFGNPIILETQEEKQQKAAKKRRTIGLLIAGGIVLLALAITTWYYGIKYVKDTLVGHPTKELLEGEWYHSSYGYPAITLETPKVLKSMELPLPEEVKQALVSNATFAYGSMFSSFYVMVSSMEYIPEIEFNMENAITGSITMIESQKGISNIQYEVEDVEIDGKEVKKIVGTLLSNGTKMDFVQLMIEGEHTLQQFLVFKQINDSYAQEIQERILKSIQIQTLPKEEDTEE